jgi:cytochrome P450
VPEEIPHVSSARDPALHSVLRKTFSHGFSAKALAEQEGIVQGFIDLFIVQLARNCTKKTSDVVRWYNFVTFDIIGELTFGEPFGSLSSGPYSQQSPDIGFLLINSVNQEKCISG